MSFSENNGKDRLYFKPEKSGGIVRISCAKNGKYLIRAVPNISAFQTLFEAGKRTRSAPDPKIGEDWIQQGPESFYLKILMTLPREKEWNDEKYSENLNRLLREVLSGENSDLLY